ncbi:hypothetical protein V5799_007492 [Amblyomma americanum]|uniref:Peptidase M13 N-terminal domain-containing protein n=1 Tax=Amblyomma americanum TaxID=6943 RepID=A0AAQ4FFR2_AMBAM
MDKKKDKPKNKGTEKDNVKDKQKDKKKDEHKDTEKGKQKDKGDHKSTQKNKQEDKKKDEHKDTQEDKNERKGTDKNEQKDEGKDNEMDKKKDTERNKNNDMRDGQLTNKEKTDKDEAQIASRRKQVLLLVASCLAGICLVSGVVFVVMKLIKKRTTLENLACTTSECHKAVKFVESFTDKTVKPCDDLYRHVCGRWLRKVSKPTSFMADVARNFSVLRATSVASYEKRSSENEAVLEAVSKYYRSCNQYFSGKQDVSDIVTQFLRHLNITPTTWLQWENEHPVFKELVRLSVVYQLPSFFLVSIEQNAGNATWTIYHGKAFLHRISDGSLVEIAGRNSTDYFRKVLKTIGEAHATDWTMKTIMEIDNRTFMEDIRNDSDAVTQTQLFGELVCDNFPPKVWLGTLNSIPGEKPQANENTTVYAPSFSKTCQDLNRALRNPNSRIRTLYALALIAAEVLRFDYQLSAEDVPDVTKLAAMCYEATRFAFEDIWVQVMSSFLSMTKDSETSISDYFQYIIHGISKYTSWMDEVDRTTVEKMLSSFKLLSFSTGVLSDEQLRCSRYDRETDVSSDDFVLNRVRVYNRIVGQCSGRK